MVLHLASALARRRQALLRARPASTHGWRLSAENREHSIGHVALTALRAGPLGCRAQSGCACSRSAAGDAAALRRKQTRGAATGAKKGGEEGGVAVRQSERRACAHRERQLTRDEQHHDGEEAATSATHPYAGRHSGGFRSVCDTRKSPLTAPHPPTPLAGCVAPQILLLFFLPFSPLFLFFSSPAEESVAPKCILVAAQIHFWVMCCPLHACIGATLVKKCVCHMHFLYFLPKGSVATHG